MSAVPATATVGIAQWLPVPGEPEGNEQTARAAVAELAARGADLVVLPEMWLTGYDPGRLAEHSRRAAEPLDGPLVTLGGSRVIAPDGEVVASLPRTGSGGVEYLVTEIKLAQRLQAAREESGVLLADRRPEIYRL